MMAVGINLDDLKLTNRDMVDFQQSAGKSITKAFSGDDEDWMAITALFWILKRKQQPDYTFDDALDAEITEDEYQSLLPTMPAPSTNGAGGTRTKSRS